MSRNKSQTHHANSGVGELEQIYHQKDQRIADAEKNNHTLSIMCDCAAFQVPGHESRIRGQPGFGEEIQVRFACARDATLCRTSRQNTAMNNTLLCGWAFRALPCSLAFCRQAREDLKKFRGEDLSYPVLAFHGTQEKNITPICQTGFRIPGASRALPVHTGSPYQCAFWDKLCGPTFVHKLAIFCR